MPRSDLPNERKTTADQRLGLKGRNESKEFNCEQCRCEQEIANNLIKVMRDRTTEIIWNRHRIRLLEILLRIYSTRGKKSAKLYMEILPYRIWTQSKMLYVMLNFGKTQKYYFLNRMNYIEGILVKSSG